VAKVSKTGFKSIPLQGFIEFPDQDAEWKPWELAPFVFMGIFLGLAGALFCECIKRVQQLRIRVFRLGVPGQVRKGWRIVEALAVTVFTMLVTYAMAWGMPCTGDKDGGAEDAGRRLASPYYGDDKLSLFSAHCADPETEASGVATVLLESREHAIKALFSRDYAHGHFEEAHLALLFLVIFCLTLCTFGLSIPAGLFIPNIMSGACFGRLVGQLVQRLVSDPQSVHPGIYALMGATGMLAGFSRMTVSLGVIMLEITSNARLILPIMIVIMTAKLIGDCFTPSAYDIVIALKNIPMLEQEDEKQGWRDMAKLPVTVCGTKRDFLEVVYMSSTFKVCDALRILSATQHNAWPVLDTPTNGRLLGLLTRSRLLECLEERDTIPHGAGHERTGNVVIDAAGASASSPLAVRRFVDDKPFVVLHQTSLRLAYRTFRAMGLRHLCVVDAQHKLVSFITRTDLAEIAEELVHPHVMQMRDFSEALKEDELGEGLPSMSCSTGFSSEAPAEEEAEANAPRCARRRKRELTRGEPFPRSPALSGAASAGVATASSGSPGTLKRSRSDEIRGPALGQPAKEAPY